VTKVCGSLGRLRDWQEEGSEVLAAVLRCGLPLDPGLTQLAAEVGTAVEALCGRLDLARAAAGAPPGEKSAGGVGEPPGPRKPMLLCHPTDLAPLLCHGCSEPLYTDDSMS
jgi:hypothetical protein